MLKKLKLGIDYIKDMGSISKFCISLSLKSSKKYFIICNTSNLFLALIPFIGIYFSSQIINLLAESIGTGAIGEEKFYSFLIYCMLLLAVQIINKILTSLKNYADGMHREIMHQHIKYLIMEKTATLDLAYFDSSDFYDEMSDASSNSPLIIDTAFKTIDLLKYLIQLIFAFIYLCGFSWILSILTLLSIIPEVLLQKKQLDSMYNLKRKNLKNERKMYYSSGLITARACVKDVKLYNLFPFIGQKFSDAFHALFSEKQVLALKYTKILAICSLLPELITILVTLQLGWGVLSGMNTMGDYSYYQGIAGQLLAAMYTVVYNYGQLMDGKMRIQNYKKFMNWENKVLDQGKIKFQSDDFKIEFRNVSFRYDDNLPLVLKNVSFIIQSHSKVAFVGVNGSGKTTIVKLILRYYDPTEGEILINDINIKEYTVESLRRCFSTLFQDYFNYAYTIRESTALSDYTDINNISRVNDALEKSGSNKFVQGFPNGIETYLTRQYDMEGKELSGGQWQKMAVARTFFRDAVMYILDEPSAALDAEAEDELFRQFEHFYEGKTAILVSHRLSNITNVDQIFVLENGSLLEQGTHRQLMEMKGRYAYLYQLQADKYSVK